MKDDNTNKEGPSTGTPNPFAPKPPPKKTPEERARDNVSMVAASQFAYTLTIGTLLFGFIGMWLGNKLGGAPWNILFMLLFGGMAFVGEVYRMYHMFTPKKPKSDGKGDSAKKDVAETDSGAAKNDAVPGGKSGSKPDGKPGSDADLDCGCDHRD